MGHGAVGTCSIKSLCPVKAMCSYLFKRDGSEGYLFCHKDGAPLTRYQVWRVTALALEKVVMCGWRFAIHTFRILAPSIAAALGYGSRAIKS